MHGARTVVEDGARCAHVKLPVDIAADAGRTGGLDVDLGQAIGRSGEVGLLMARSQGVRNDLRVGAEGEGVRSPPHPLHHDERKDRKERALNESLESLESFEPLACACRGPELSQP